MTAGLWNPARPPETAQPIAPTGESFGARMAAGRLNNFDLLRLAAALQVVFQHLTTHLSVVATGPVTRVLADVLFFFPGVPVFFVISGFLVSLAYERADGWGQYAVSRLLRIYPALWVCFGVTLGVLTAVGALTARHLVTREFWVWVGAQLTVAQWMNPTAWRHVGVGVINGSLWTIPVELQFYATLPLLYRYGIDGRTRRTGTTVLGVLAGTSFLVWCVLQAHTGALTVADKMLRVTLAPYLFLFVLGMFIRRSWDRFGPWLTNRAMPWTVVYLTFRFLYPVPLASAAPLGHVFAWVGAAIAFILLALSTVSLAFTRPALSGGLLRGVDLSYGVYLYHMLVVNVFVVAGWTHRPRVLVAAAVIAIGAAALSWLAVEKPARRLKPRPARLAASQASYRRVLSAVHGDGLRAGVRQ